MPAAAAIAEMLRPLRAEPRRSAVLLDVDGTLAPIVRNADEAHVPEATRGLLIQIAESYGTVACISGRPAAVARRIVAIGSIAYVGNHGCELLGPGATETILDPLITQWQEKVRAFAASLDTSELGRLRVRGEDKGPIHALHWRGAPDEEAALDAVREIESRAMAEGLEVHWGRKVLEIRPPLPIDKGSGVVALLAGPAAARTAAGETAHGLYMGDDSTDVDAFRGLRAVLGDRAICVGVRSDETPAELERQADLMVDGHTGVREVLQGLLR